MKTAALSMGPVLEFYSWQEPGSIYTISSMSTRLAAADNSDSTLPDRDSSIAPSQIAAIFTKADGFPKDAAHPKSSGHLRNQLPDVWGDLERRFHPECDRLSSKTARSLVEHATRDMARIYRRQLGEGLRLYINNRRNRKRSIYVLDAERSHIKFEDCRKQEPVSQYLVEHPSSDRGGSEQTGEFR